MGIRLNPLHHAALLGVGVERWPEPHAALDYKRAVILIPHRSSHVEARCATAVGVQYALEWVRRSCITPPPLNVLRFRARDAAVARAAHALIDLDEYESVIQSHGLGVPSHVVAHHLLTTPQMLEHWLAHVYPRLAANPSSALRTIA